MSNIPKLFVTGATGQLGGQVIDALLETVSPSSVIAGVRAPLRNAQAANALRQKGVEIRAADYSRPETLAGAFTGVDRLLLISSSEIGRRKVAFRATITDFVRDLPVGGDTSSQE